MEKERTVIHLEINGEHHYYGSIARMFEDYAGDELGITYASLRNYCLSSDIIRKGVLLSKSGNRGIRKQGE